MTQFDELNKICDTLLGPNGCPWDRKQTFQTLRPHILEEAHELMEAIDEDNTELMVEELGDVLFQVVFLAKLGERSSRFTFHDIIQTLNEKLIRRHPHVFGDLKIDHVEDLHKNWERIKKLEKKERKHALEGIPKTLGALARAQKVVAKMISKAISFPKSQNQSCHEEVFGDQLLDLIIQATQDDIDAESALRKALKKYEDAFIQSDKSS